MGARAQHDPAYQQMCQLLRQWRDDAGLTQRALAAKLGVVHSLVHKMETGERRIDPLEFCRWCLCCGVDCVDGAKQLQAIAQRWK